MLSIYLFIHLSMDIFIYLLGMNGSTHLSTYLYACIYPPICPVCVPVHLSVCLSYHLGMPAAPSPSAVQRGSHGLELRHLTVIQQGAEVGAADGAVAPVHSLTA